MKTQIDLSQINKIEKIDINVVSMFSGCGGSSLGYKLNGCSVLAANEFDLHAQEVYALNHPTTILLKDDIRKISGDNILQKINVKKYDLDILDGSPPCASFSTMGLREKAWGKEKNYSGTRQVVDDLFFEFARILSDIMPKVFICENVKGLTTGGAKFLLGSKCIKFIPERTIIDTLSDIGYTVSFKVLNSMYYGVPQMRERLIIIGVRNDLKKVPSFPKRNKSGITTEQAIGDLINLESDFINSPKKTMYIQKYFRPGCSLSQAAKIAKECKLTGVMLYYTRRDRWKKPFQTILQSGDRAFHPIKDRPLSILECKRLCTFPDDFILPHTPQQNWERLGRAVPPNLMKNVVNHVLKTIFFINQPLTNITGDMNEQKGIVKRTFKRKTRSSK